MVVDARNGLLSRASLNQATIRNADLDETLSAAASAGFAAVGLWREPVHEVGIGEASRRLADSGMRLSSVCRAGYYPTSTPAGYLSAVDDTRRAIEETAELASAVPGSSSVLVVVSGGMPAGSRDLVGARESVRDAIGMVEADAVAAGVTLAIEALHPMLASDRGVVSTLSQALDIAEQFGESVGVVVDTYHVWWDPALLEQIGRAGNRIASYQVSDWVTPIPEGALLGRGIMGQGCIDFESITRAVDCAGYDGDIEVEIFNQAVWDCASAAVAIECADAFGDRISPWLMGRRPRS